MTIWMIALAAVVAVYLAYRLGRVVAFMAAVCAWSDEW
jgi:hypothetical protein